jgi:hypothetical protein
MTSKTSPAAVFPMPEGTPYRTAKFLRSFENLHRWRHGDKTTRPNPARLRDYDSRRKVIESMELGQELLKFLES